jgi:hypothetical protein
MRMERDGIDSTSFGGSSICCFKFSTRAAMRVDEKGKERFWPRDVYLKEGILQQPATPLHDTQ